MKLILILNREAGTLRSTDADAAAELLAATFREHGHAVSVELHAGKAVVGAIERICTEKEFDALIVGGGDGTISAAASAAAKSGMILGILPLGTMNLFARSLGIPLQMQAAAEALAGGKPSSVDIGEVNGRFFVHVVTLGLHVKAIGVRERMTYSSRLGKMRASFQAWWEVVREPPRLDAEIRIDGRRMRRRTSAIAVSNNPLGEGHLPYADDPRQGTLGVYVVTSRRPQDLVRLAIRLAIGAIAGNPHLDHWLAREVDITLAAGSISASVDGELVSLQTPLRCRLHARGLRVLRPATDAKPTRELAPKPGVGRSEKEGVAS